MQVGRSLPKLTGRPSITLSIERATDEQRYAFTYFRWFPIRSVSEGKSVKIVLTKILLRLYNINIRCYYPHLPPPFPTSALQCVMRCPCQPNTTEAWLSSASQMQSDLASRESTGRHRLVDDARAIGWQATSDQAQDPAAAGYLVAAHAEPRAGAGVAVLWTACPVRRDRLCGRSRALRRRGLGRRGLGRRGLGRRGLGCRGRGRRGCGFGRGRRGTRRSGRGTTGRATCRSACRSATATARAASLFNLSVDMDFHDSGNSIGNDINTGVGLPGTRCQTSVGIRLRSSRRCFRKSRICRKRLVCLQMHWPDS
ncbi:hypothetical protein F5Y17DRAFT_364537 [Xylariaceae sp. FL0594]|nr:hypothetical protein F5Y17DRAFT_364537 [Xylariaceae sp. FL0594]